MMKGNTTLIKTAYLVGVIIDGLWAIILAFPSLYKIVTNNPTFEVSIQVSVIFIIASSLMLGWTFLLYWGYRKPVERRFILAITAFPVVFGIFIGALISFLNGSSFAIIFLIKTFAIMVLFTLAFIKAEKIIRQQ